MYTWGRSRDAISTYVALWAILAFLMIELIHLRQAVIMKHVAASARPLDGVAA
jgi:hypothetical protein